MRCCLKYQSGFTLVELAIVMTIIGLLIGGILKGQELMLNARVTATIAQVRSFESAATTFRDSFSALPGDLPNAAARLLGCNNACNPSAPTAGNSIVGLANWTNVSAWPMQAISPTSVNSVPQVETILFWKHMLHADLISGVTPVVNTFVTPQWGVTHPQARINGGFIVGYADGISPPPGGVAGSNPSGLVIAITASPSDDLDSTPGEKPMSAAKAVLIDRKMDDGRPSSGFVQAYGVTASCYTTAALARYNESSTSNDCGLLFRI